MSYRNPGTFLGIIIAIVVAGCGLDQGAVNSNSQPLSEAKNPLPTPASTLDELILNMSSDSMTVRLVSIYELEKYKDKAAIAMPSLIDNLHVRDRDVRVAAAIALGHLGPSAQSAIPDLIYVLHNDTYIHARDAAAVALRYVGDSEIVPDLALALFEENSYGAYNVQTSAAASIAKITGEKFTDFDSTAGYLIDENGVPLIVSDARNWWLKTGQYKDWSS